MKRDYDEEREQIQRIMVRQSFKCEICRKQLTATYQRAHKVPQWKRNIERYGNFIHHDNNIAIVCGLSCNSKFDMGGSSRQAMDKFMEEIGWKET